jgi:hypothetical protein
MGPQTLEGPRIGHITRVDRRFQTVCPRDEVMVGIEAIQKELLRDIAVRCATPTLTGGAETDGPRYRWQPLESTVVGRVSGRGNVFSLACPSDSLVTGTLGRHGRNIDAIGIGCEPIAF